MSRTALKHRFATLAALVTFGALAIPAYDALLPGPAAARSLPAAPSVAEPGGEAVALFAGGCFWGVEAVFEEVKGVKRVVSGYAGGSVKAPTYAAVGTGRTGHAEAVKIVYDPRVVSYGELLQIFFGVAHDPTQAGGQHPDYGSQYRGAVFPMNAAQDKAVRAYVAMLGKRGAFGKKPIATRIEPFRNFYPAEAYHQDFARRNPLHPYIVRWDAPKLAALRKSYPGLLKS
jgi:peptide-methionine (S)-S-oxide reductase